MPFDKNSLLSKLEGPNERVGFVLKSGEIVEVENVCDKPEEGFEVSTADLAKYINDICATWHTHPGKDSNLSMNDWYGFLNFPDLDHYIVGTDGVSHYRVQNGKVIFA